MIQLFFFIYFISDDARIISVEMHAPNHYRGQMIKMFGAGRPGRLTVNWGGTMRYIDYMVTDAQMVQETVAQNLKVFLTLRCPDVFFNDMSDFGENIAATMPLIIFPNLWYVDTGLVSDYKLFDSTVVLQNSGDAPIGLKLKITALKGNVLNPVIYLTERVYFRVYVQMLGNDVLEISTVRREKYVRLNGENILNKTDMSSTFFEIEPGVHKIYYNADDGMENMNVYLHRRPQYLGV